MRFSEVEAPANALSVRLRELTAAGLLSRKSYDEVPPRVEFEPTEKVRGPFLAFAHLHAQAMGYDLGPAEG
ncbi:winged helix-turn-helix transcriptional regulator [Salinilacihabitans rarus]|uniref:winged helix-turn-helix transcriptional regulator n=1 Tax=Salinilacihabitans rarus TaxID=2961596 RepID=UPI0020C931F7|nr:winged helix-turn-helix transcriptional regulator [Salinilacihabitans rarus]